MEEVYKQIEDTKYSVSNFGNVRNDKSGRILKQVTNNCGYKCVCLYLPKLKYCSVHRLVAKAFIPNPDNLSDVNHIDEDKTNNHVSNLEWLSHKDNLNYGSLPSRRIASNINNLTIGLQVHLLMKYLHPTLQITKRTRRKKIVVDGVEYNNTVDAAKSLGLSCSRICQLQKEGRAYYLDTYTYEWRPSPIKFNKRD